MRTSGSWDRAPRRLHAQHGVGWKSLSPSPPLRPSRARMRALPLSTRRTVKGEKNSRLPDTAWARVPGPACSGAHSWPPQGSVPLAVRVGEREVRGGHARREAALRRVRVPQAALEGEGNPTPKSQFSQGTWWGLRHKTAKQWWSDTACLHGSHTRSPCGRPPSGAGTARGSAQRGHGGTASVGRADVLRRRGSCCEQELWDNQ